jgi:hypothetical protein
VVTAVPGIKSLLLPSNNNAPRFIFGKNRHRIPDTPTMVLCGILQFFQANLEYLSIGQNGLI